MRHYKVTMILLFVCLAFSAMAQKGIKLHLKVGDKWSYEQKSTSNRQDLNATGEKAEFNAENILTTTYEILGAGNGTYDIKATFSAIKFKATSVGDEGEVTFDSQKAEDMDGDDGELVKRVIGKSYVFTIDANTCKVIAIKERPVKEETPAKQLGPLDPAIYMFPQEDNHFTKKVESIFGGKLPNEKLVTGFKWDKTDTEKKDGINTKTDASYAINRIQDGKIYVSVTNKITTDGVPAGTETLGEFKITGLTNGTGSFSIDAGSGLKTESKSTVKSQQTFKTPKGEQITNISTSHVETVKKLTAN